jgi:hypothetical protein
MEELRDGETGARRSFHGGVTILGVSTGLAASAASASR